jgi:nitronate monooxygenase
VLLAGAISRGEQVLAAQVMGADLAYVGTRFIATAEANAADAYKAMLVEYSAADIVYTSTFTGVPGNYLGPSIRAAGLDPEQLPGATKEAMNFGDAGQDLKGRKAWKDIWSAGQGIGAIHGVTSMHACVEALAAEYAAARAQWRARFAHGD